MSWGFKFLTTFGNSEGLGAAGWDVPHTWETRDRACDQNMVGQRRCAFV